MFNVVASVKFNEKLRDAVEINVLGTKKILDLVMGIKHLKVPLFNECKHNLCCMPNMFIDFRIRIQFQAFLHISTLYSNCNRKLIEEKVYESDIGYEKIIQVLKMHFETDSNIILQ